MSHDTHANKHDHQVECNGKVGQGAQLVECSNLAQDETYTHPNQAAHDIAEVELGHLRDRKTIADNKKTNANDQLNGLEEVDCIAEPRSPDAESKITVVLGWEFVRVNVHESLPENIAGARLY